MLVGPRAGGKTTTAIRLATTVLRLDQRQVRDAIDADPDVVLAEADPPVLVDEWQLSPDVLGAGKRLIDANPTPVTFPLPAERPDTAGYVDRALASGFPEALARTSTRTRSAWLESYIDHLVGRDVSLIADVRDPGRLRRYLRALAATTAAMPKLTTLVEAAELNRVTAERYDQVLERLFVTEQVPAWSSNRLSRVTRRTKRYVCDAAIGSALLGERLWAVPICALWG